MPRAVSCGSALPGFPRSRSARTTGSFRRADRARRAAAPWAASATCCEESSPDLLLAGPILPRAPLKAIRRESCGAAAESAHERLAAEHDVDLRGRVILDVLADRSAEHDLPLIGGVLPAFGPRVARAVGVFQDADFAPIAALVADIDAVQIDRPPARLALRQVELAAQSLAADFRERPREVLAQALARGHVEVAVASVHDRAAVRAVRASRRSTE